MSELEKVQLSEKQVKARKGRSLALGILLAVFVVVVYLVTVVKFGPDAVTKGF